MEYITLIEPRQQGKTSLIHRLAQTMGPGYVLAYASAIRLDKTDEAAWYVSLCRTLFRKMNFIPQAKRPSFPHNGSAWGDFMAYLAEQAEASGCNLVIALDELGDVWMDWRIGFFSNIRAIFDERPNEPCFQHVTFMLAGTYNPRALVSDPRTSPFNVAQRVHLPDFTPAQTDQLVAHLELPAEDAAAVAQRIHYWTDGQPYLTQRLCRTLAEGEVPATPEGVDLVVERLYREDANHLPRILEALDPERQPKLRQYVERVLAGHQPQFRPASEGRYHGPLALIGILKADEQGRCKMRNRIYEQALQGAVIAMPQESSFTDLHQALIDHYDLEEFRTLCAQLGVPFDDLRGEGRQAKARELILWLERRGRLGDVQPILSLAPRQYDALGARAPGEPLQLPDVGTQLRQMDTKVDALLQGQTALAVGLVRMRADILNCIDASARSVVQVVVGALQKKQLETVQTVLDGIDRGRATDDEVLATLNAVRQALQEMQQKSVAPPVPGVAESARQLAEVVDAPGLDVKHRLKAVIPIIPMLLQYEGEISLDSGMNLEAAWNKLVDRLKRGKNSA
jgi:hypothetical protein